MREIEFRIWSAENKYFINSYSVNFGFALAEYITSSVGLNRQDFEQKFTLQQFTGLRDKNGKKIYEGDIVKYLIKYNDREVQYECVREVKFNKGSFYPIPVDDIVDGDEWYSTYYENYEVIGNIFETPELLCAN